MPASGLYVGPQMYVDGRKKRTSISCYLVVTNRQHEKQIVLLYGDAPVDRAFAGVFEIRNDPIIPEKGVHCHEYQNLQGWQ